MTDALTPELRLALVERLTALADDELILSHRDAEWVGHAPILEEDIALANIAQDELGHAGVWLSLRSALDGGSDPDTLAFRRGAHEYRCARLVELPRGDWAFTLTRQFLFDAHEAVWTDAARASTYAPLAEAVEKIVREERFHLQHTALWVERLGLGTEESRRRTQAALDELWPLAAQLFAPVPGEDALVAAGIVPDLAALRERWTTLVTAHLRKSGLNVPATPTQEPAPRTEHTEHLADLLREMQEVASQEEEGVLW
ncbi:1,2-phenylacetyl-CoA epoxidase subunit PaaC [Deinococcus pimensis]|uniref:1,2-phenylacetyl-CoA epoxidase subunit PaaC n=1 Tax=Deinococcus pimensis TaxID=309888 RepID=UPI000486F1CD|nr:1,2-phenylacetyl-CoA epoxidase subunit PaaC [Deinococcus pimensis]